MSEVSTKRNWQRKCRRKRLDKNQHSPKSQQRTRKMRVPTIKSTYHKLWKLLFILEKLETLMPMERLSIKLKILRQIPQRAVFREIDIQTKLWLELLDCSRVHFKRSSEDVKRRHGATPLQGRRSDESNQPTRDVYYLLNMKLTFTNFYRHQSSSCIVL